MLRSNDLPASTAKATPRFRRAALLTSGIFLPAFFAMACVTVNIYFPAPEVREAAERIVDETWGGAAAPAPVPGKQSGVAHSLLLAAVDLFSPAAAIAAEVDVNVSTASIRAIKDGMKQRAAELKPYLASGAVGIYQIPSSSRRVTFTATAPNLIPRLAALIAVLTVFYGLRRWRVAAVKSESGN